MVVLSPHSSLVLASEGKDKSFDTEHTDFDAREVLKEGTSRAAFYHDMDVIAEILRRFLEERIPILWRLFHESYGTGSVGSAGPGSGEKPVSPDVRLLHR